jgi:hypothetical protein
MPLENTNSAVLKTSEVEEASAVDAPSFPVSELKADTVSVDSLEETLQETGDVLSQIGVAAMPLVAGIGALVTGLVLNKAVKRYFSEDSDVERPMEMGADFEEQPFSRRGVLQVLSALPLVAATPAMAAKSGGRMGGSNFRSAPRGGAPRGGPMPRGGPVPRGGPAFQGGPNVTMNFGAPRVYGSPFGYGYGAAPYAYSYGFSSGELMALNALQLAEMYAREQRRQAYFRQQLETQRQLGRDQAEIQQLQQQLREQEDRMRDLEYALKDRGATVP